MWNDICKILKVNPDETNPKWNPKSPKTVETCTQKMIELVGNKKEAEEIIGLALVGELSIVRNLYPY